MAGFSDYLEKKLLNHVFGGATYTPPATLYFGLATAAITDSTTGTTVTEPSGGSYARSAPEQAAPDWRPPATIDLYGPPRYARGTTDGRHS